MNEQNTCVAVLDICGPQQNTTSAFHLCLHEWDQIQTWVNAMVKGTLKKEYHWGSEETQTDMNIQTERPKVRTGIQNLPTRVPMRRTQTNLTGNACEGNWNVVTCDLGVINDT